MQYAQVPNENVGYRGMLKVMVNLHGFSVNDSVNDDLRVGMQNIATRLYLSYKIHKCKSAVSSSTQMKTWFTAACVNKPYRTQLTFRVVKEDIL